ncbi:hypothetical protein ABZ749_30605 [Micromonospora sp. NPDC047753]|uniref:hypothetical protein n=1 Tax=Micromonospora sp. NPDC047753 TaxID=3154817 RepID=UPI0033ECA4FC
MADAVRRGGAGLRRASAPALVALLATAAIAPVVAVGTPTGPVLMAGAGVLGSVGANVLTDVLAEVVARLRRDGKQPDREELQRRPGAATWRTRRRSGRPSGWTRSPD